MPAKGCLSRQEKDRSSENYYRKREKEMRHLRSKISEALRFRYQPIAISFTDVCPQDAVTLPVGKWACVTAMVTAAMKGKTVALARENVTCWGAGVGLCMGDWYDKFPGGIEYFLSTGRGEGYRKGERYKKSPELARAFVDSLPMTEIKETYVTMRPLHEMGEEESVDIVVFYATADQLSALAVLANYDRGAEEGVILPFSAGCQSVCLLPYAERLRDLPRAVVGMTDISARPRIDRDLLSFAVPYKRFVEMEENADECFFHTEAWQRVVPRLSD